MVRSFLCGRVHFGARAPLCLVPPFDLQSRRFGSEGSSKHELLHTLLIIVRFCPRSAPAPSPVLWSFEPQGHESMTATTRRRRTKRGRRKFSLQNREGGLPFRCVTRVASSAQKRGKLAIYSAMMMKELFSLLLLLLLSLIPIGTGLTSCATSRPRHADSSTNHRGHRTTLSSSSLTSSRRRRQQRRE